MRKAVIALLSLGALLGCSNPMDTPVPRELDKLESLKPVLDKLSAEERQLFAGYVARHTLGAAMGAIFGGKTASDTGIPAGATLGSAIDEQRKYLANTAAEEAKAKALKEKLIAEREAALKSMREAVTVTVVSKGLQTERIQGMLLDEKLEVTLGYQNNTGKDIAGVKGTMIFKDLFDSDISRLMVSNDATIKAGATTTWTGGRSVRFSMGHNDDRKLAEVEEGKYKAIWEPETIVFSDGTKLTAPEAP